MSDHGGVWLVTGIQAAGKSTVADLLARQLDPAVHIRSAGPALPALRDHSG
ncbi:MAG TPA: hypothetical protein VHJ18_10590 [Streptosporangiaceae bacterium]|nr:hypothetical protein [Streptosporangiaceae bacterium]